MTEEDKTFEKFVFICYVIGMICFAVAVYIWAFGIPNFEDTDAQALFCHEHGEL